MKILSIHLLAVCLLAAVNAKKSNQSSTKNKPPPPPPKPVYCPPPAGSTPPAPPAQTSGSTPPPPPLPNICEELFKSQDTTNAKAARSTDDCDTCKADINDKLADCRD